MSTGFLITNLGGKLKQINDLVNQYLLNKLYIYVAVNKNQPKLRNNEWISKKIVDMYSSSSFLFPNLDVRIILNELKSCDDHKSEVNAFDVDVIILPKNYDYGKVLDIKCLKKQHSVVYTENELIDEVDNNMKLNNMKIYQNVVLGGTFDRLHNGHKILLSEALLRCSNKITVGVTDENMIKGKKLPELIEPSTKRMEAVKLFIEEVNKNVNYEVVLISDMYGPTRTDPNLNMIVVSTETHSGATKINELRKENGLSNLDIHVVDLAEDSKTSNNVEEKKISSSNIRMRLLGTYLKEPEFNLKKPSKPYLIGLTGGVASGKSSICQYLSTLGAGVVDCDKIGHNLYKRNSPIYKELVNIYGEKILKEDGEINRKYLGSIVFKDPNKLQQLNQIMWPAILETALAESERLYKEEKKEIVFLEAAVLIRANWHKSVQEVWCTIIPKTEAINRVMTRNNLSEEEANLRINAQPENSEFVEISNVVFCSLWSYEFTRQQVDKAWNSLKAFLKNKL